ALHLQNNYQFDEESQHYIIPVGVGSSGCRDFIFIAKPELCAEPVIDQTNCKRDGQSFEEYFASYYSDKPELVTEGTNLAYAFFDDYCNDLQEDENNIPRCVTARVNFTPGQLDAMLLNMWN